MSEDESSQEFKIEKSSQQNQQLEKHHMQLNIQPKNKPQNSNLLDQPTHHKASEDGDTEKKDFKDVDMLTSQQKEDMINVFYSKARSDAKDSNNSNLKKCQRPKFTFKTKSLRYLEQHMRQEHSGFLIRLGICEAACTYCKLGFEREDQCQKHEENTCELRPLKKVRSAKQKQMESQFDDLICDIEE